MPPHEYYDHFSHQPAMRITPSMSSLEALLSKLPSVGPASAHLEAQQHCLPVSRPMEVMGVAKEEYEEEDRNENEGGESSGGGGGSGSMAPPYHHRGQHYSYHHDLNVSSSMNNNGC